MALVAKRKTAGEAKLLYKADLFYQLLIDYVFGYKSKAGYGSVFTRELLLALGLFREKDGDDWVTAGLHLLFGNAYFAKREQDGLVFSPGLFGTEDCEPSFDDCMVPAVDLRRRSSVQPPAQMKLRARQLAFDLYCGISFVWYPRMTRSEPKPQ